MAIERVHVQYNSTVFLAFTLDISEHPRLSHAYIAVTHSLRPPTNDSEALLRVLRSACRSGEPHVYARDGRQ